MQDFLGEDDYFAYSFTRSRYDDFFGARTFSLSHHFGMSELKYIFLFIPGYQTPYIVNDAVYTGGPSDVSSLTGSR